MWDIMNEIVVSKPKNIKSISVIKINNDLIKDELNISNCFNQYFSQIGSELIESTTNIFEIRHQNNQVVNNEFKLENTTSQEIQNIIMSLNGKSAVGYDKISAKFLKRVVLELKYIYSELINKMFNNGVFPECFKLGIVSPIYKKDCKQTMSNYRGISVLTDSSKIVEKILYKRVSSHLNVNKLIHKNQFGFVKNTTSACIHLFNEIRTNIDNNKFVACTFIDLKKAFDTVNHQLLVDKLKHIGIIEHNCINIFESYLFKRCQKVKIGSTVGEKICLTCGIPQGSILGPLLFTIFINDIFFLKLNLQLYADDMVLVYSNENIDELFYKIQEDLNEISNWLKLNLMYVNAEKTNYMIFDTKNKFKTIELNDYELKINNKKIERIEKTHYLGLLIDNKLKFDAHIRNIKSKLNSSCFALRKICSLLPERAKWFFFHSCIMSHISYLNPIWNVASDLEIKSLKMCINRAIKIIKRYPRLHSSNLLYSEQLLPINLYNTYSTDAYI